VYPFDKLDKFPDKAALVMAGSGRATSYAQLDRSSNRFAQLLRHLGLGHDAAIALLMENRSEFFTVCWGAQRSGLFYTPVATHLATAEIAYIINDCGARAFVTSAEQADNTADLPGLCPDVQAWFVCGGELPGYRSLEGELDDMPDHPVDDELEGCEMLYSSGTTGYPKGIRNPLPDRSVGAISPMAAALAVAYGADENTVYLSPAPLYHSAPLRFNMALQRLGATCVVMEKFDARSAVRLLGQHGVTMSQWVPTHFSRMLQLPKQLREKADLSSHRLALHAAAPCPVSVKEQMIDWWGPILTEFYSATEGNGATQISSEEWLTHKGSVGRELGCRVHVVDDEGEELAAGEIGTVYFEGGRSFEYHNAPEKTADSVDARGWSTVGDIGYLDEEGYLYLTDRKADMIISGGVNIYPQETENCLLEHPSVADAAVFGLPDSDFGEQVKAVVEAIDPLAAGGQLADELMAWCRDKISPLKCPRSIDFVDHLPRTEAGKLRKHLLKARYDQEPSGPASGPGQST